MIDLTGAQTQIQGLESSCDVGLDSWGPTFISLSILFFVTLFLLTLDWDCHLFQVLTDARTHEARGSAFVRFDRREEAEKAIEALDGALIPGSFQPLVGLSILQPTLSHTSSRKSWYYL